MSNELHRQVRTVRWCDLHTPAGRECHCENAYEAEEVITVLRLDDEADRRGAAEKTHGPLTQDQP